MTTDPLFSVVTITRNNLAGLKRTAESVLHQTFKNYEWIVVDGLSDDGTEEFLSSLSAQFIREKDSGIYDAMNKGIVAAQGEWTTFLNAGDSFADMDILNTLSGALEKNCPDFLYGDALEGYSFYKKARSHKTISYGMFTHHQAMLYRTALLKNFHYDLCYKIAADYDLTLRFLREVKTIHYIPAAICIFESGGISQQKQRQGRIEQFLSRKKNRQCNLMINIAIFLIQTATSGFRSVAPKLYSSLRNGNI
jgi:putative colanic acid biosynthesis glycosyltransferase